MYKSALLIIGIVLNLFCAAQQSDDSLIYIKDHLLSVNKLIYDFGTIDQNDKAKFKFEIINNGTDPLVIKHVTTSCECTSPSFTQKPINPNDKAFVKIKYDSSNIGSFNKSVFVYTNRQDKPLKLQIKGMVNKPNNTTNKSEKGVTKTTPNMQNIKPETSK